GRRKPPTAGEIEAVLGGVANLLVRKGAQAPLTYEAVAKSITATSRVLPLIDQLGILAQAGNPAQSERVARETGAGSNVERTLFARARRALVRHPEIADRRFRMAEAWRGSGRAALAEASKAYAAAFEQADNPEQVAIVL